MLGNALVKTFSITLSLPRACENSAHIVFDKQHNYVISSLGCKSFLVTEFSQISNCASTTKSEHPNIYRSTSSVFCALLKILEIAESE